MALIIEGNMPSCCAVCCDCNSAKDGNFCNRTGKRLGINWQLYRPLDCPIRGEIPDKHGALKDANALKELTKNTEIRNSRGEIYPIGKAIAKMIDEAPTVVESEE